MRDVPDFGEDRRRDRLYFERVGGGNEFRANDEMQARWFRCRRQRRAEPACAPPRPRPDHAVSRAGAGAQQGVPADRARAELLFGRDATITPPENVHREIDAATAPTLPPEKRYGHDIRLDCRRRVAGSEAPAPVQLARPAAGVSSRAATMFRIRCWKRNLGLGAAAGVGAAPFWSLRERMVSSGMAGLWFISTEWPMISGGGRVRTTARARAGVRSGEGKLTRSVHFRTRF